MAAAMVLSACVGSDDDAGPTTTTVGPSASLAAPTEGRAHPLGFKWDLARIDRYTDYLRAEAGGATFTEVVWCDVEPNAGDEDWTHPDRIVAKARGLGQLVNLKLRIGSCWVNGDRGGHERGTNRRRTASAPPDDIDRYRDWVRAVMTRYDEVTQFAVENEVNSPSFWAGTSAQYAELVGVAAATIHSVRPGARVFDSGTSSVAYGVAVARDRLAVGDGAGAVAAYQRYYARRFESRDEFPPVASAAELEAVLARDESRRHLEYLDVAFQLARDRVIDGVQVHFYEPADAAPDLAGLLDVRLPSGIPVEAWEVGLFYPGAPKDTAIIAGEVVRSVATLLSGRVRRVIWLPFAYNPEGRRATEVRLGVADPTGRIGPVGQALAALADASGRAGGGAGRPPGRPGLHGVVWRSDTAVGAAVWADGDVDLGPPVAGARAADASGASVDWRSGGLRLTAAPLILSGDTALASILGL